MTKKIKIITDSVADIPVDLLQKWNIDVVPCYVDYGGNSYLDNGIELKREDFYNYIKTHKEVPKTAAPAPALAEELIEKAITGYDYLISINVAQSLSTTLNNVKLACNSVAADKSTVIDSETVSMGIGWMALIAAEVARKGDIDAVINAVNAVKKNHKLYAGIYNMEYLRRSGRVSAVVASIGSILQIKPIVQVIEKGQVISAHRVRTFSKVREKLRDLLAEEKGNIDKLAIIHAANEESARQFMKENEDLLPQETIIAEVGPTLGTHIGPDSLGFISVNKAWHS